MNKLFFALLFLTLATYAQQERVAIIQTLDNKDSIDFQNLLYLTDKLRETAVKILPNERFGVMTTESIIAFLGSQEKAVKACNESSCLAELGRMVSADYVAQGRIGRFGKDLTIKVELYNVKTGTLMDSFTGDSKDIYGLRDIIDGKAPDLFKKMLNASNVKKTAPPPTPKNVPPVEPEAPIAKKNKEGEYDYTYVQRLIEEDFEKNKEKIQKESFHISPVDREVLYEKNRRKAALGWAALNVLPGFGLGSYIQGDLVFGVTQSVLEVTTFVLLSFGDDYNAACLDDDYKIIGNCSEKERSKAKKNKTLENIFAGILLTNFTIGLIRPFYYQSKQNKALKEALNINDNYEVNVNEFSLSIDPIIVPRDGTPAVGLAFNVRY